MLRLLAPFALLPLLLVLTRPVAAQSPDATTVVGNSTVAKAEIGVTVSFQLAANQTRDLSIALPAGGYTVQSDIRATGGRGAIQMRADLFKSDGTVAQNYILSANETRSIARVAKPLTVKEPINAYLRIKNGNKPAEYRVTIFSNEKRSFAPFSFSSGNVESFSLTDDNGKSGKLEKTGDDNANIVYKAELPAGEYRVYVLLKNGSDKNENITASLLLLDRYGIAAKPDWRLDIVQSGSESRKEKTLTLTEPGEVYFLLTNDNSVESYEYTIGIQKPVL
ncbi:MAG: hypothetical protein H7Y38_02655 [Armatimonadetes bacterium]|nr:hypothetical protein [Armatimonadota bacterium]